MQLVWTCPPVEAGEVKLNIIIIGEVILNIVYTYPDHQSVCTLTSFLIPKRNLKHTDMHTCMQDIIIYKLYLLFIKAL